MKPAIIILFLIFTGLFQTVLAQAQVECGTRPTAEDDLIYVKLISQFQANRSGQRMAEIRYIPIHCHIIRESDGTGGIDVEDIDEALEIVNTRYAGVNFHFFRCSDPNYIDDDGYFESVQQGTSDITELVDDHSMTGVINIFFVPVLVDDNGVDLLCGFARFPWTVGNYVFMDNGCTMNESTLAHELGHYFGLYHTHHSSSSIDPEHVTRGAADPCFNCEIGGDLLCDTEADPGLSEAVVDNLSCNYTGGEEETCNDDTPAQVLPYDPDATNLMSYSRKHCRTFFSAGQLARLEDFYINVRMAQLNPEGCSNSPCYEDLVLPSGAITIVSDPKTANAENSITSTEDIEVFVPPGVAYKAGRFILLLPGFSTAPEAIFSADIENCFSGSSFAQMTTMAAGSNFVGIARPKDVEFMVSPNPFSQTASIQFHLQTPSATNLRVADQLGNVVATILDGEFLEDGAHAKIFQADGLAPGVYYLILSTEGKNKTKMVVVMP